MTRLEQIERDIEKLNAKELDALAAWLDDLRERLWDEQIARDAEAGKLDALAGEALRDLDAGRTRPLPGSK